MIGKFKDQIMDGMVVRSSDGEKLGKVVAMDATGFIVEKGLFFPKDYTVSYNQVLDIRDGEIILATARDDLRSYGESNRATGSSELVEDVKSAGRKIKDAVVGTAHEARAKASDVRTTGVASTAELGKSEHIRVPVVEEELIAHKGVHEAGEVRIRKEVITEQKTVTVPVTREVVTVERVPAGAEAKLGDKAFTEETIRVPVREEHVDIEKRARVREEVRIDKDVVSEQATASADVRRERVDVDTTGTVKKTENFGQRATGSSTLNEPQKSSIGSPLGSSSSDIKKGQKY